MTDAASPRATSTPLHEEAMGIVSELTRKYTLNGGRIPSSAEDFWRYVGLSASVAVPQGTCVEMAQFVLEHLGATWDDDFDDDGKPSQEAYEALMARMVAVEGGDEDEDEDDDATGELAAEARIFVSPMDLPVETLIQYVNSKTLVLDPDWQRGYVWKAPRKRRFIESIFMSLPIPPVLLFQDRDNRLYVIDGRQRLETLYRFSLGTTNRKLSFTTFSSSTPGWEQGKPLGACAGKRFDKLPPEYQTKFTTFSIPARIFHNLERRKLYEVFKRYNTGGDKLNPAEIRNAVYQGLPLHDMILRLAGERRTQSPDAEERNLALRLQTVMKGKTARYGAYNFIGRVLAFAHVETGSVANAINKLMEQYKNGDPEPLRLEFIRAFNKTWVWYPAPLAAELSSGKAPFHEWIATIQMVSTIEILKDIDAGRANEDAVRALIDREWTTYVHGTPDPVTGQYSGGVLQEKQNTTTHWKKQVEWIEKIRRECCSALTT